MTHWMVTVLILAVGQDVPRGWAQENESPPRSPGKLAGVISKDSVNLRGQATLNSEVVTQLDQGAPVIILEEIAVADATGPEPAKWYRVALPDQVPVWVHSAYIDPGSLTVTATRLNARKGPGENFSVLAQLDQGTVVKVIETQGDWIKIKAPESAYAFVASYLVSVQGPYRPPGAPSATTPALADTRAETGLEPDTETSPLTISDPATAQTRPEEPMTTESTPADPGETELAVTDPNEPPLIVESVPDGQELEPAEADGAVPAILSEPLMVGSDTNMAGTTNVVDPAFALTGEPPVPVEELGENVEEMEAEEPEPELPKKVVYREGIVRRSTSIQAPTYFILVNPYNGKTMDYLHSPSNQFHLQDYYGARVLVKGEEMLDERWPKTPVITIETLETVH